MLVDVDKNSTRALVNGEDVRDVRIISSAFSGAQAEDVGLAGDGPAAHLADVQGLG